MPRAPHTVRTSSTAAASTRRSKLNNFMSNQNTHPNAPASQTLAASTSQKGTTTLLGKKPKVPAYMQSLNQQEKAENFKILDNMNKKISYKKNPRYKINKAPIIFTKVSLYKIFILMLGWLRFSWRQREPIQGRALSRPVHQL